VKYTVPTTEVEHSQVVLNPSSAGPIPAARSVIESPTDTAPRGVIPAKIWGAAAVLVLLLVAIYFRIAGKLIFDWYDLPDYSHGFLVPLFSLYIMWETRETIRQTPIRQSWSGVPLIVLGACVVILGVYGADLFLSRISFLILAGGLIWTFLGRAMLKVLRFPLLILLLAIPFPEIVFNKITFPLQLLASDLASAILPLFHVPVLHEGNVIELPVMKLEVAEACSGIRSLMSLFTLAVFYGYFLENTIWRRVVLAFASVPIAVAANAARIVGTGLCVQYWDPEKAMGFFHEFSGWVMFVISLSCLYLVHRIMRLVVPHQKAKAL
jgi:exosortase